MSSSKASKTKGGGLKGDAKNAKGDKSSLILASDDKNGYLSTADDDELNSVYQPDSIDQEKYETFRRIASAEESEELGTNQLNSILIHFIISYE